MAHSWVSIVGWLTLAVMCAVAWLKGSPAERLGATWVLAMYLASDIAIGVTFPHVPQFILFALDFALALGLLLLAIRYSSLWLGTAMLLQSIALGAHAFRLVGEGLGAIQWMILNNAISELMMICIIIAATISWRSRHRRPTPPAFTFVGDAPVH